MKKVLFLFLVIISFTLGKDFQDTDNDLVADKFDKCPNTPAGVCVDQNGCTQVLRYTVHFDSDSDLIEKEYVQVVNDIVEIASECYGYKIYIKGHTDSISSEKYNLYLSKKRAQRIQSILGSYKIDQSRIHLEWLGETTPVSTNVTSDGRYENRRVEVLFK